ncbi:hypothetical protein HAX54_008002 [Datura stramonium]|uniref:Uncharacterized protein n=1 Tax=Datura stramonium TaxID=4076 RepID=A0ABS8TE39_DATST|nr:hypothetical protein [Datura stramonium]
MATPLRIHLGSEETLEVIAHLEEKIAELSHMVMQTRAVSQTPPNTTPLPDVRKNRPMLPPPIPISDKFDQGDYFNTSQQVQNTSSTHPTQNFPLVYTFAPPKAHNTPLAHHGPLVDTYVAASLETQT